MQTIAYTRIPKAIVPLRIFCAVFFVLAVGCATSGILYYCSICFRHARTWRTRPGMSHSCDEDSSSDNVEISNFQTIDRKFSLYCEQVHTHSIIEHLTPTNQLTNPLHTLQKPKFAVRSDGHYFRVTFRSNGRLDGTGFRAAYEFVTDPAVHNAVAPVTGGGGGGAANAGRQPPQQQQHRPQPQRNGARRANGDRWWCYWWMAVAVAVRLVFYSPRLAGRSIIATVRVSV